MTINLDDDLEILISNTANYYPPPKLCKIVKIYQNDNHVDIKFDTGEILSYVKNIGNPTLNREGLLIFLDSKSNKYVVIC